MSISNELRELFTTRLSETGLSEDDFRLIAAEPIIAQHAADALKNICTGVRNLLNGDVKDSGISLVEKALRVRKSRTILTDDTVSEFEIILFANMMEFAEKFPGKRMTAAAVADLTGKSRQSVSRGIKQHKIDFEGLKRRLP